ncbi:MAG: hypothetical protein ACJ76K_05455 [Solirubrobacteraceae bacterium]
MARELCILTPLLPDRREALAATLAGLPDGEDSPLARVPGTHFARWVRAPSLRRRTDLGPDTACLVFAVEFDHRSAREYLEDLCRRLPDEADLVWRNCAGYPGAVDHRFVAWLLEHRVEPGFSIVAFPSATVAEVREALALRARTATFAVAAQRMGPERLRQAWREHVSAE